MLFRFWNLLFLFGVSGVAYGQLAEMTMRSSSEERAFHVSAPVVLLGNEFGAHVEFNLGGAASFAIDYVHIPTGEEYNKEKMEKEKTSLVSGGHEVGVQISRFTRGEAMGGFYYSVGAGYRVMNAVLKRTSDNQYALSEKMDDDGRLTYDLKGRGATARGRIGYRFVGDSFPITAGGFLGIRHYESRFEDGKSKESVEASPEIKAELRRNYMTRPEAGVELGFVF